MDRLFTVSRKVFFKIANFYRLNYLGLMFGLVGYILALTPSLMPRPTLFLGIVAGLGFGIGYGIGVFVSYALRWVGFWEPKSDIKPYVWNGSLVLCLALIVVFGFEAARWQNEVRLLVGEETHKGSFITLAIIISLVIITIILLVSRGLRRFTRFISRHVSRVGAVPKRAVSLLSVIIVIVIVLAILDGVVFDGFKKISNDIYSKSNQGTDPGIEKPSSSLKSGSDGSLVSWDSLGRTGRSFVAGGPTAKDIAEFNSVPSKDPIRVYAGYDSAQTIQERADLAVKELERTGAFKRSTLVVMTSTGSGWIEPQSADSVEYMHNGDTALVSVQYSYLPSWISLLVNQDDAKAAGQELFDSVYEKWSNLPEDSRPKLIVYGLSLGSFGGQSAFSGSADLAARTDGALFMGTPSFSSPWIEITDSRDVGSPEIKPVYKGGKSVRFAATNQDINSNTPGPWDTPRSLFLQHPSDPVVWWNPSLILHEPDYLSEPRGYDVSPDTRWYPFITFIQATIDQFFGVDVPAGHGHNYPPTIVNAWASVTSPNDWNSAKASRLQDKINQYPVD